MTYRKFGCPRIEGSLVADSFVSPNICHFARQNLKFSRDIFRLEKVSNINIKHF